MSDGVLLAGLNSLGSTVDDLVQRQRQTGAADTYRQAFDQWQNNQPMAPLGQAFAPSAPPPVASSTSAKLPTFAAMQGTDVSNPATQQAISFYQSKGLSPIASAALVGGFTQESGPGLNAVASNPGDGRDGSTSLGIAQWNGDRARALQQFAASNGLNPNDINTQLQFSWAELNGPERAHLAALQSAQNPLQATVAALGYERPAGWSAQNPLAAKSFGPRMKATASLAGAASPQPAQMAGPGAPPPGYVPTRQPDPQAPSPFGVSFPGAGAPPTNPTQLPINQPPPQSGPQPQPQPQAAPPQAPQAAPQTLPAMAYAGAGGAGAAPASRAIAAAAPASGSYGLQPLPIGGKMLTRQQAEDTEGLDHTDYDAAAAKAGLIANPAAAPAFADAPAAGGGGAAPVAQAVEAPAAVPIGPQTTGIPREVIRALLSNPDTAQTGMALWQQSLGHANFGFMQVGDQVVRTNSLTGEAVPVPGITKAPQLQHFSGKDNSEYAFNPSTGGIMKLNDGGPGTSDVPRSDYAGLGYEGYAGTIQRDADGKLIFPAPPGANVRPQLVDVPQSDGTVQKQWVTPPIGGAPGQSGAVGVPFKPSNSAGQMSPTAAKLFQADNERAENLRASIGQLQQALDLNDKINTGMWATGVQSFDKMRTALGFQGSETGANTDRYNSLVKQAYAGVAKAAVGGRVSNYEERIFQDLSPNSDQPPLARAAKLQDFITQKQRELHALEGNLVQMKAGTYFATGAQGGSPSSYTPAGNVSDALSQARAAIQAGADPSAVKTRLQQHGIDPGQL